MKVLFLTDNFPPEVNAPATRTYEHCREWVKKGAEITIITCVPNFPKGKVYEGYKNRFLQTEYVDGIKVIRVWSYIAANKGFVKRILDFISYAIMAFLVGLFIKTDIIFATSPQFFTAIAGRKLSFWKRKPWIMEVRDLWPESIKNVNVMKDNFLIKYLEWEEMRCYRKAKAIITVTDSFKKVIVSRGIPENKFEVVKNGANLELFKPKPKNKNFLSLLSLENKFIVAYIGTHGMAHKLDFLLQSAKEVTNPKIHFLFIGDGAEKEKLVRLHKELELSNVTLIDSVSKNEIVDFIASIDVALINLKKSELFKTVIPSKIFENAAMKKPILLGVDGESRGIVEDYYAGLYFEPENQKEFLGQLNKMFDDVSLYTELQEGCKKLALDFDRKKLAEKLLNFIEKQI